MARRPGDPAGTSESTPVDQTSTSAEAKATHTRAARTTSSIHASAWRAARLRTPAAELVTRSHRLHGVLVLARLRWIARSERRRRSLSLTLRAARADASGQAAPTPARPVRLGGSRFTRAFSGENSRLPITSWIDRDGSRRSARATRAPRPMHGVAAEAEHRPRPALAIAALRRMPPAERVAVLVQRPRSTLTDAIRNG